MRKKRFAILFAGIMTFGIGFSSYAGQWKSDETGYWYEEENGSYVMDEWRNIGGKWYYFDHNGYMMEDTWIGDYYVGEDGAMLADTLTKDGYWLDGDGIKDEKKRIYGEMVFNPTNYKKEGDRIEIVGDICDTGYMAQEEIEKLRVGDWIVLPDKKQIGRVREFTVKVPIVDVKVDRGLKTVISAPYYYQDEGDPYALPGEGYEYWLNSQSISEIGLEGTIHMGDYVYRIVKKDAMLIADSRTEFIDETAQMYGDETRPKNSLETYLQSYVGNPIAYGHSPDASKVLQISITGNHIDQAVDMFENYVG